MAAQCETTELTRFPELRDRVVEVVNHMLRKCVGPTQVRKRRAGGGGGVGNCGLSCKFTEIEMYLMF